MIRHKYAIDRIYEHPARGDHDGLPLITTQLTDLQWVVFGEEGDRSYVAGCARGP